MTGVSGTARVRVRVRVRVEVRLRARVRVTVASVEQIHAPAGALAANCPICRSKASTEVNTSVGAACRSGFGAPGLGVGEVEVKVRVALEIGGWGNWARGGRG